MLPVIFQRFVCIMVLMGSCVHTLCCLTTFVFSRYNFYQKTIESVAFHLYPHLGSIYRTCTKLIVMQPLNGSCTFWAGQRWVAMALRSVHRWAGVGAHLEGILHDTGTRR